MRRARLTYRIPDTERRALSTQRRRFHRVGKLSAFAISLAAGTLPAAAT
jgi:hypothetical protein